MLDDIARGASLAHEWLAGSGVAVVVKFEGEGAFDPDRRISCWLLRVVVSDSFSIVHTE